MKIVQNLGCRFNAGYREPIPRSGTGDVEQVALSVVDLFQVGLVSGGLDARSQRNHLVVTGHDGHGTELQTLGKVNGTE